MPRRNYGFDKRQLDLKKKQKQEDKLKKRLERRAAARSGEGEEPAVDQPNVESEDGTDAS